MVFTLIFDYYRYWYTSGFVRLLKYLKAYILILANTFSVKILLKTFFSPWRRDVTSMKGLPLDEKAKVLVMNVISRVFGSVIKTITLAIFLISFIILMVFELLAIFTWLLLPIVIVEGIVLGILFIVS